MQDILIYIIIGITAFTSIRAFSDYTLMDNLKFNAAHIKSNREWYRFFSYGLVHADWMHLALNMWVLYAFSGAVIAAFTYYFGAMANLLFILLYISALAVSTFASYYKHHNNYLYNAVGASGAVSAILYASILVFPTAGIGFIFLPVRIPAWIFGILYLAYSAYMSKKNIDNVGHDAHFWGALYGFVFPIIIKPELFKTFLEFIVNSYF
jgi:membrane associated rhomboid family serine protease